VKIRGDISDFRANQLLLIKILAHDGQRISQRVW
jgi:hypothetical protein